MSRICQVVRSDGFAGVERYVCDVSSELGRRGWDITVIGGDLSRMRPALEAGVALLPATTTLGAFRQLRAAGPFDVVHSHMTAADVAAAASRLITSTPVVSTRHFTAPRGGKAGTRLALRLLLRKVDRRLAISRFVADSCPGDGEHVLLNGVADQPQVPHRQRRPVVVVLQRHEKEKDTGTALRAWALSSLRQHGWRLALAGTGSESAQLRLLCDELGLDASVDLLGFVADPLPLLADSRALLATAAQEPFGLSVVEAMAAGAAVLAAGSGGHLETVGPDGWFFPASDPAACAALLDRLHSDPEGTDRYGQRLRDRQRSELSLAAHVDALERHYRDVLGRRAAAARP